MEQHLHRMLEPHELVHHINGDKVDNDIDNLVVITKRLHSLIHDKAGAMKRAMTPEMRSAAGRKGAASRWSKRDQPI